jgi:sugar O-acyltransferase (sialic acid O-acetyltransferase NeuD family)
MGKDNKVILVGGFHEIIELCEVSGKSIVGIIDNQLRGEYYGYEVLGDDNDANDLYKKYSEIPLIITPDLPNVRKALVEYYSKIGFKFCNLIHTGASISKYARIGNGVIIQNMVNVSTNVIIKDFVKISSCANIMHDTMVDSYSTIAPNAVILGRVKINESCYIGSNSTVLPNLEIGSKTVVGAGSVVTKNVPDHKIVKGVPAK